MYSKSIQRLIEKFTKFPTIGKRTAARFVFYLLKEKPEEVKDLIKLIQDLKNNVKYCKFCFKSFEGEGIFCSICKNPARDKSIISIVEKEQELTAIEETGKYKGLYFVLGDLINFKKGSKKLPHLDELIERIKDPSKFGILNANIKEAILALNPTTKGKATAFYLEKELAPLKIKITRLGQGLPVGGELEYADEETLSSALQGRR